jgi:hypothetical protein
MAGTKTKVCRVAITEAAYEAKRPAGRLNLRTV